MGRVKFRVRVRVTVRVRVSVRVRIPVFSLDHLAVSLCTQGQG